MSLKSQDSGDATRLRIALVATAAYLVWIKCHPGSPSTFKAVSDGIGIIAAFTGGCWGFHGARRLAPSLSLRQRWGCSLIASSLIAYGLGMVVWFYDEVVKHRATLFPSWADACFLLMYPLMMIGVLLLPHRALPTAMRGRVLLDSVIAMTGLVTFSWYFLLGPTVLNGADTLLGRILGVGYPLGDLAALFCLLIISAHPAEASFCQPRRILGAGILAYVFADVVYGYMTLKGTYVTGQYIDAGWTLGNVLIGLGAASYRKAASQSSSKLSGVARENGITPEQRNPVLWRSLLPYSFIPAVALLIWYMQRHTGDSKLEPGVYVGSAILIALVGLRQVLALLENNRLYHCLQEAYQEQEADHRALAESNARLETLATTDGMTGLANHRSFQERLRQEMAHAERIGSALSLLFLDVDQFKQFNDSFGHPAGDEALRIVAGLIQKSLRPGDFSARYGGEEFAIILPVASGNDAALVAERIRNETQSHPFSHRSVTLSIGVTAFEAGIEAEEMIRRADSALYSAKNEGRNCVRLASREGAGDPISFIDAEPRQSQSVSLLACSPTVLGLRAALALRDEETEEHSERVARYAMRLLEEAEKMKIASFSSSQKRALMLGSLLHDIGKIGVPDAILHKPGRLDAAEWARMCEHPENGRLLVSRLPELKEALPVVQCHHESWNGSGYPSGLAGERIPMAARIFAIADALDAMTSDRPYRQALSFTLAREEIARVSGQQFDPSLVDAFLAVPTEEWQRLSTQTNEPNDHLQASLNGNYLKVA